MGDNVKRKYFGPFLLVHLEKAGADAVQKVTKAKCKEEVGTTKQKLKQKNCDRCGTRHASWNCPAYGRDCRKCGGKNHFAKCCFTKKKVQTVKECPESDDDTVFFIGTLADDETNNKDEWIACKIGRAHV